MVNILTRVFRVIQFIWLLPATLLVWLAYIIPLLLKREIKYVGMTEFLIFEFRNPIDPQSWYDRQWKKWGGWSGPCVLILRSDILDPAIRRHELQHCEDQLKWGIFFYPAYILSSLWIWISNLWREKKRHPYHDNWFEVRARRVAGQKIFIPRKEWIDGPDDFNPWW